MNGCALWQGEGFPLFSHSLVPFPEHDNGVSFVLFLVQTDDKTRAAFAVTHLTKRMGFNKLLSLLI